MKLHSIQFLRAVAAILVVYTHSIGMQANFSNSSQQSFFYLRNFGCIGVDLFFVISGFIITLIANNYTGTSQGLLFLKKRFMRINPIYYIASLLYLGVLAVQIWATNKSFYLPLGSILNSLSDTIMIFPVSGDMSVYSPLLLLGWTLCFEWFFYIIFFTLVIFNTRNKVIFLILAMTLLTVLGYIIKPSDFRLIFVTNPIILEFLLGIIICWIYLNTKTISVPIAATCLLLGLGCYIYLIFYGYGDVYHYKNVLSGQLSMKRFLIWGIPSCLIVAGSIFLERNGKGNWIWKNKWMQLSGDASYSIYLSHLIVFELFNILFKKNGSFLPADMNIILVLSVSLLMGLGFYKIIEKPLLQYINKIPIEKQPPLTIPSVT
ncbi:hypothetical protein A3860_30500 [Niastella vici]|uniref:Acyltransferase 3 domain-containing protein n=1 Tax=Niastella vici TaxID=1703345 RepID=A0A1V9FUV3_9BACT|nr:acyltransferase [Niastella vici]OQP62016.1 hypothetical protein A3860_30500 [Niastella vici]